MRRDEQTKASSGSTELSICSINCCAINPLARAMAAISRCSSALRLCPAFSTSRIEMERLRTFSNPMVWIASVTVETVLPLGLKPRVLAALMTLAVMVESRVISSESSLTDMEKAFEASSWMILITSFIAVDCSLSPRAFCTVEMVCLARSLDILKFESFFELVLSSVVGGNRV